MAIKSAIIDAGPTVERGSIPETLVPVVSQFDSATMEGYVLDGSPDSTNFNGAYPDVWVLTDFTPTEEGRLLCASTRQDDGTFDAVLYCAVDILGDLVWKRVLLYSTAINTSTGYVFNPLSQLPGAGAT